MSLSTWRALPQRTTLYQPMLKRLFSQTCIVQVKGKNMDESLDDFFRQIDKQEMYKGLTTPHPEQQKRRFIARHIVKAPSWEKAKDMTAIPIHVLPQTVEAAIHNPAVSQYFSAYPHLSREEMEEPPPPVSGRVKDLLNQQRANWVCDPNGNWKFIRPRIPLKEFKEKRKQMIKEGEMFPILAVKDKMLDPMPRIKKRVLRREDKLRKIDENMSQMGKWVQDFKLEEMGKRREQREQDAKLKDANAYIERMGLHPKDPAARMVIQEAKRKIKELEKAKKQAEREAARMGAA